MIIAEGRLRIEWYGPDHLDQLRDLHRCCFPKEEWTPHDFQKFAARKTAGKCNVVKVLVDDSEIVYGALLYTLDTESCRVRRVSVWPDYRRKGLASFMVNSLCGASSPLKRPLFVARVRETNAIGQLFFKNGMNFAFDPRKRRARDEEQNCDYYEFSLLKPGIPVVSVRDD